MSANDKKREDRKRENQKYLREHCDQIMRRMVLDILKAKPDDVLEFMANWIGRERGVDPKDVEKGMEGHGGNHGKKGAVESDESEEDVDDDAMAKLNKKKEQNKEAKKGRSGVSAEVYGKYNKKEAFKPRVVPKSDDVKKRIFQKLNMNFMFKSLEPENKEIVINAIEEKHFK